ncbi:CocE/NonD family hydrolase [Rubinisphaera margarita]|uniref:CocE/NonD family hydrolase n=1 Tax=Rubinisphaera margarita TaxID=2909586 RepID=UPI001EE8C87C|nr:CocE/NonD family hydrolase [Rubinisphaera margarita]MCG6158234.1 CocE/NonD family hydrolase [Rubinisphaera margarita]
MNAKNDLALEVGRSTRIALWGLLALFCMRVLGQFLVETGLTPFLPPSPEWFSGLIPYPWLLSSQVLIIGLMVRINLGITRQWTWYARPHRALAQILLFLGIVYLSVMAIRYSVRMSLYPAERWTGRSIPIFFHWVLACYVLTLGGYFRRRAKVPASEQSGSSMFRRVCLAVTWVGIILLTFTATLVWTAYLLLPSYLASELGARRSEYAVIIEKAVPLTTRDGVELKADVYRPYRLEKTPTILVRLPFSHNWRVDLFASIVGRLWAERGYTAIIQGVRGRGDSRGEHVPFEHEREDSLDTLNWVSEQSWYNGQVGMWGGSYFAYTQWVIADQSDPGLDAMIVMESSTDHYGMLYPQGVFALESALYWALTSYGPVNYTVPDEMLERGTRTLPVIEADDRASADIGFFNNWVTHRTRDEYWKKVDGLDRVRTLQAPVLLMGGWYDPYLPTQLNDYRTIQTEAKREVAEETRLIIGPWIHAETIEFPNGFQGTHFRIESLAPTISWFDRHLKGKPTPEMAPVRIFVMGRNEWRDEQEWPLEREKRVEYFLTPEGETHRGGTLRTNDPGTETTAFPYTYDPDDPVPTQGGPMLGTRAGIRQQNDLETRTDVLVFSTDVLEEPVEVTGVPRATLYVRTSAASTDFTVKLVDVYPDGSAWNICDGLVRIKPEALAENAEGEPMEVAVELWPTSNVFLPGHRIRIEVSSSNFPRYERNLNTGQFDPGQVESVVARQTLYCCGQTASRIELPVIPAQAGQTSE